MLEQLIRRVDFHYENGELTPRFGPLMNDGQIKNLLYEISRKIEEEWAEIKSAGNPDNIKEVEINERLYNREFATLRDMNLEGWRLESFASVLDANQLRIQVAIFSRLAK